ncbi:uncharacterized protein A1O5_02262 [Cladophialophora psammophila CBS 110553]|uniref:Uncharacterized protein n=1 Tax=Cladophialophora psammophila CBS 110553 TaxID=1182543 RepID=W9X1B9_9EURO|nr:uncharacterized protein A1O5_02262 [Cladophialophora psammophila CBS 110553]EXJ73968.1 hypothetical protein A1O5_02262 [Cladophialophora psammophila CBS 110553]
MPANKANDMTHTQSKRLFAAECIEGAKGEEVIEVYSAYVSAADSAKVMEEAEAQDLTKRLFVAAYIEGALGEEAVEAYPAYVNVADSKKVLGE